MPQKKLYKCVKTYLQNIITNDYLQAIAANLRFETLDNSSRILSAEVGAVMNQTTIKAVSRTYQAQPGEVIG